MAGNITMIERLHYQSAGRKTLSVGGSSSRKTTMDHQAYSHDSSLAAGSWTALDAGFVGTGNMPPSMVLVTNKGSADIQIGVGPNTGSVTAWTNVKPKESVRFDPPDMTKVWLKSTSGTQTITTNVIPT